MKTKTCNTTPIRFATGQAFILYLKTAGIAILMVLGLFFQSNAQYKVQNIQHETFKYVKIEIDHRGLHCPFLGVALKDKLKNMKGFKDFYIDKDDRFLIFSYPAEMSITHEELMKIPIDIGFPKNIVHVAMADKPFEIENGQRAEDQ